MGLRFLQHPEHTGPGPIGQGTVVGTPEIGTQRGPKQAPPDTQFGGTAQVPNTTTVVNEGGAWPENRGMPIISNPASASREFLFDTRAELQAQPAPGRILRQLFARVFGYTSVSADPAGGSGWPYNGDMSFIPHQLVPRKPYGPSPYARTFDNNAPISAVYAGNPRGGR